MEKADALIKISETANKYRPWWDEVVEKVAYVLIWFGSFLWIFYLANGGDITRCYPILTCPSLQDVSYNKSNLRTECEKYRHMKGYTRSQSFSVIVHFQSIHQYETTNIFCSQQLQGQLFVTGPFLVLVAVYLLFMFRLWYVDPRVETHLNSLHRLVMDSAKMPHCNTIQELVDAWNTLRAHDTSLKTITDIYAGSVKSLPCRSLNNIETRVTNIWDKERRDYFLKRRKLVAIISRFREGEINEMELFHRQMQRWKAQLNPEVQSWYIHLRIVNAAILFVANLLVLILSASWNSLLHQDAICETQLEYDVIYTQVKCRFSGSSLIMYICVSTLVFLVFVLLLSIVITIYCTRCMRQKLKYHYLKFYGFLSWKHGQSCTKTFALFDKLGESCFRQIVTDSMYPLQKLSCQMGDNSKLLTYTVEGAIAPVPSCLFSETIDNQEWCLEIREVTEFQNSDFLGFNLLTGLKELNVSNCYNICCQMESHWIRKLHIISCTMQNRLLISDQEQEDLLDDLDQNCWRFPNLELLVITDPRPFEYLNLRFCSLSELFISNATIDHSLDELPDVKTLTLKSCKIRKGITIRRSSDLLSSLTLKACNIRSFPALDCPNLSSLDLSENYISFAKEYDRMEERGEMNSEHKNDGFQNLPKLEKLFLRDNQITSLDFDVFKNMNLRAGLQVLDVRNNPLEQEKILSDISILQVFTTERCVSHLLDMKQYANYSIESVESEFPSLLGCTTAARKQNNHNQREISFPTETVGTEADPNIVFSDEQSEKHITEESTESFSHSPRLQCRPKLVILYCDIKHDQTRRRMMLYISCIAQLLYRNESFMVCDTADVVPNDIVDLEELYIVLALRPGRLHSTIGQLQCMAEYARDKGARVVTICEIEYGEPPSTRETLDAIDSCLGDKGRVICNYLKDYPIFKTSSLFRQIALKLRRGKSFNEIISEISTVKKM